jgi:hypothetical protein
MLWKDVAEAIVLFAEDFQAVIKTVSASSEFKHNSKALGDIHTFGAHALVETSDKFFASHDDDVTERLASVESLVSSLSMFEASDPRDTIYGLLSIAKDTFRQTGLHLSGMLGTHTPELVLEADYSKNILEVFKDYVAFSICKSGSLDVICRHWAPDRVRVPLRPVEQLRNDGRRPPTSPVPLPSWIGLLVDSPFGMPDTMVKARVSGDSLVGLPDKTIYNASRGRPLEVWFGEIDAVEDSGTL